MECELSSIQTKRKRLKSIIKHDGAAKRRDNSQREYYKIFQRVLEIYLDAKQAQPYGSSLVLLDASLRSTFRRWTQDSAHTVIDFENAVTKGLANAPELQEKFTLWFLRDERPEFKAADMVLYNRIIKKCAGEFLRRGMYPIWKWFRTPQRPGKVLFNAAITKS
jgi:hypothetical protein